MVLIKKAALELALGVSRRLYPREFMGLLRADDDAVTEIIVLPATIWGEDFAQIDSIHLPADRSIVGSIHSHPSRSNKPSKTDLMEFGRSGDIHMIIRHPYKGVEDVACYDREGRRLSVKVVE